MNRADAAQIPLPAEIRPESITALVDTREQMPLDLAPLRMVRGMSTGPAPDRTATFGRESQMPRGQRPKVRAAGRRRRSKPGAVCAYDFGVRGVNHCSTKYVAGVVPTFVMFSFSFTAK